MFKIFPATYTGDGRKVPIAEMKGWYENQLASSDQNVIAEWQKLYSHKIKLWAVPTGAMNGIIALDVDVKDANENGFQTLQSQNYYLPNTRSQTTKSGGKHFLYRYPTDGRRYGNRVKFAPGLDIRGEGGYVAYYGLDDHPIAEAPQWLLDEALKAEKAAVDFDNLVLVAPNIVQAIIESACENVRQAPEGESNNVLNTESYRVGQLLPSGSIDRTYAYDQLYKAARERGKPHHEAHATIESGFSGGSKTPLTNPFGNQPPILEIPILESKPLERWTPRFLTRYDLTNMSKLRKPQLFKDWSTEDISITTADGGTGKTTLKLNEAISLALGESFLGFECVAPGRTLFITGEDSEEKLAAMLGAIMKQMGLMERSPENDKKVEIILNSILIKKESEMTLITKTKEGFIRYSTEALEQVAQAIEDLKPRMIVFDPISSFWGSEAALNDMSKAVATFMGKLVERASASVEVINHMGKASSKDKDMSQFAGRGGTGLPSHARVSRVLRPISADEFLELTGLELGDDGAILCNVNKFSDGSPLYNKPFVIRRQGYLFTKIVLQETKVREEMEKMTDSEKVFDFIVGERNLGRYPSPNVVSGCLALSKDRVKKAIDMLQYSGHMGERIKSVDNPDASSTDKKVFVITDMDGNEV